MLLRKTTLCSASSIIIVIGICVTLLSLAAESKGENYETEIKSKPMLITSLRNFEPGSNDLLVFRKRNGSVIVKAREGFGIMAVVQEMNLQEVLEPHGCFDYIQLGQIVGNDESKKLCGHVAPSHSMTFLNAERPSFVDNNGYIELSYMINEKTRLSPLDTPIVNFNISFTPFQECPEDAFPLGNENLRPCSMMSTFSCIPSRYFCDGVVNCAFPGDEFGLDEQNCGGSPTLPQSSGKGHLEDENKGDDDDEDDNELNLGEDENNDNQNEDDNRSIRIGPIGSDERKYSILSVLSSKINGLLLLVGMVMIILSLRQLKGWTSSPGSATTVDHGTDNSDFDKLNDKISIIQRQSLMSDYDHCYDVEKDLLPSYADCMTQMTFDGRPVYLALSYECEKPPPPYSEVRLHKGKITLT
jgi:hypothetical protein